MRKQKKETVLKETKTKVGQAMIVALPMLEEVVERGLTPMCVIGARVKNKTTIDLCFATLADEHDATIYKFCEEFISQYREIHGNKL